MIDVFKAIFVILVMTASLIIPANAQSGSEFGYKLHPEKFLENTVGDLEIFAVSNDIMVPKIIQNLKFLFIRQSRDSKRLISIRFNIR